MIYVEADISGEGLLEVVLSGIDLLAEQRYADFIEKFGYSLPNYPPQAEWIVEDLAKYRSDEFFPGIESFVVSDWRSASGGNPEPLSQEEILSL